MTDDTRNLSLIDADFVGDFLLAELSSGVELSDASDLILVQPSHAGTFAPHRVLGAAIAVSPFGGFIGHVVGGSSEEKVIRMDAGGIVAMVTDQQSRWDQPVSQFPRKSMRYNMFAVGEQLPVSTPPDVFVGPTSIAFDDILPEPLLDGSHFPGVRARSTTEAPFPFFDLRRDGMERLAAAGAVSSDAWMSHDLNIAQVGQGSMHKVVA